MASNNSEKRKVCGIILQVEGSQDYWLEVRGEWESGAGLMGLVGGGEEDGETPLEAIHREIIEETGLDPDGLQIEKVDDLHVKGNTGEMLDYTLFRGVVSSAVELTLNEGGRPVKAVRRTREQLLEDRRNGRLTKVASQIIDHASMKME